VSDHVQQKKNHPCVPTGTEMVLSRERERRG
jgi:hypothetical protein